MLTVYCISHSGHSGSVWYLLADEVREYGGEVYTSLDLLAQ